MSDERALAALQRIEVALARIEAASARNRSASADPEELKQLRDAHHSLRAKVESAIGQIDRLLETEA